MADETKHDVPALSTASAVPVISTGAPSRLSSLLKAAPPKPAPVAQKPKPIKIPPGILAGFNGPAIKLALDAHHSSMQTKLQARANVVKK
jgi:hypothetical protein